MPGTAATQAQTNHAETHNPRHTQALSKDIEALSQERSSTKAELDRTRNELTNVTAAMERYQARTEQLVKEMDMLEERMVCLSSYLPWLLCPARCRHNASHWRS